jgi:4'-phosphopantetheinyl transferase
VRQARIQEPELLTAYRDLLSDEELSHIDRFKIAEDRHTALLTRALIRWLLTTYCGRDPRSWEFATVANGKPVATNTPCPVAFNLSHTRELIVAAIFPGDTGVELGVDVERISEDRSVLDVASKYFADDEVRELRSRPPTERLNRFFEYWTLKESYIKATGQGLQVPLEDFSFHIGEQRPGAECMPAPIALKRRNEAAIEGSTCSSWLLPGGSDHGIAVSALNRVGGKLPKQFRCFDAVPLQSWKPSSLPLS